MRGSIEKRSPDSWSIRVELGRDGSGRRKQKRTTFRGTKREAERELNRILRELETGQFIDPVRLTLGEYLEQWLEKYAAPRVTAKTLEFYSDTVRKHLVPGLGTIPLTKLQPLQIEAYYQQALKSGRRDGKGGLSPQTIRHHHRVLNAALRRAVRWQLLVRNPAEAVEPPRVPYEEGPVLTVAETAALLQAARRRTDGRLYLPILFAVTTGMRRGEILALRWEDIDLQAGTLRVRQALEETRAGISVKQPKTRKGLRPVTLPALLVEELRRERARQDERRRLLGDLYQESGMVACYPDGAMLRPGAFSKAFADLIKAEKLKRVTFQDLRHTHVSQLIKERIETKTISERVGHASAAFTLDVYGHLLPGMQDAAAAAIDRVLREALADVLAGTEAGTGMVTDMVTDDGKETAAGSPNDSRERRVA